MRAAVISDLHLGRVRGGDVLRAPAARARLVAALAGADRLVLLGDVLELREVRLPAALGQVANLLAELAAALAAEAEVVIVPGNHDHLLARPLVERAGGAGGLGLEHTMDVRPGEGPLGPLASALAPVRLTLAYPGLWLRPDVYATHGHWLDVHSPVPRVENLAVAAMARLRGGPPARARPADYERVTAPVYAVAHRFLTGAGRTGGHRFVRLWERYRHSPAERVLRAALGLAALPPAAVALLLRRLGAPPIALRPPGVEVRRSSREAMAEVVERLGIEAPYVVFGHTHRAGPRPGDDPARWRAGAAALVNAGSWVYERAVARTAPGESPHWPGALVVVEHAGPPRLARLLDDVPAAELRP